MVVSAHFWPSFSLQILILTFSSHFLRSEDFVISFTSSTSTATVQYFLQIFVLVVAYGLFHGLLFFPVILSIIGPAPFDVAHPPVVQDKAITAEELEPQLNHRDKSEIVKVLKDEEVPIKVTMEADSNL
jgi:hypothetical protein